MGGIAAWGVGQDIVAGICRDYGITFGIDEGSDMGYSDRSYYGSNDGKLVC